MTANTTAWVAMYTLVGLLTGYHLVSGNTGQILIERLWLVVLTISIVFLIMQILKYAIHTRDSKAYQRWLNTP